MTQQVLEEQERRIERQKEKWAAKQERRRLEADDQGGKRQKIPPPREHAETIRKCLDANHKSIIIQRQNCMKGCCPLDVLYTMTLCFS